MKLSQHHITRFLSLIEKTDTCWHWKGHIGNSRYGRMRIGSTDKVDGREKAHRMSYFIHYGNIPQSMHVCHRCDNTKCVNPKHLFLGTHQDNMKDMMAKGRSRDSQGEKNTLAKLKAPEVLLIRHLASSRILSKAYMAKMFKVSPMQIGKIINLKSWTHI